MIEQPGGTRAWETQLMNKLLFEKGVGKVNFDFVMFEMKSVKEREVRLAKKRTCIISNSQALLKELANNKFCKTVCETRLSLGPSEAKDITGTINELTKARTWQR